MRIELKPLSINEAWQGKRFKTPKYKRFQNDMLLMLPKLKIEFNGKLSVKLKYGFSSKLSDIDNPCKIVLDCLCKKYGFDDRQIFELIQEKEIVKKGNEYIDITIKELQKGNS